jgi:hypothetical protein
VYLQRIAPSYNIDPATLTLGAQWNAITTNRMDVVEMTMDLEDWIGVRSPEGEWKTIDSSATVWETIDSVRLLFRRLSKRAS